MNEKKDILTKTWVVAVLASICCMLWGSAFSCVKIGYSLMNITTNDSGSQLVFGGIRFFVAGLMALAMGSGAERKILLPTKTSIPKIMIISLFQTILQYFFYYIGLAHTTGVKAAIIVGANVFIAILVSSLLYKLEKLTGYHCYKSRGTFGGKLQFSRRWIYFSLHLCIRFFIGIYEALFRNRRPCYA